MLINFSGICNKYQIHPKCILHVGACQMEELQDYKNRGVSNVIWIEGNPSLVETYTDLAKKEGHILLQGLIYDEDDLEMDFHLTNNLQSSSILEFEKHLNYHPHINVTEKIKLKTKRLDTLLGENNIPDDSIDFINLDIQGVELRALKSLGKYLKNIRYVYTEINVGEVYKNNDNLKEIDNFLEALGFERVETHITEYEWGDAFYIKK
jgi:FkbM family methyltransferase